MYNQHLDVFIVVVKTGSFSKAAKQLYISPTAIIKQMNLLEEELGLTLFIRSTQGIKLTEEGKYIYKEALKIIEISNETINKAKKIKEETKQTIRIGTSLLRPAKSFINIWKNIASKYPSINLKVVSFDDNHENYINILDHLGKDIDIIAGIYPPALWNCNCQVMNIKSLPVTISMNINHPLASKNHIKIEDLFGHTLTVVERGETEFIDRIRDEIETEYPEINIITVKSYDANTFNQCVSNQSIMLSVSIWDDLHPSLITKPVFWDFTVPYGIIYSNTPSKQVLQLLDIIKKEV